MFEDCKHVELWHESQAKFGIAMHKTGDFHWNYQTLEGLKNGDILNKYNRRHINKVMVLETLQGDLAIIQISGYSSHRGYFCDVI